MKIIDILNNGRINISCELFPPKEGTAITDARRIVAETARLSPSFISITYGAGGGTKRNTLELADEIQNVNGVTALAHLTCISANRTDVHAVLDELRARKIENILALRGDIPAGMETPLHGDFSHASDLIREIRARGDFCIGGACYPDGHTEAESLEADLEHLREKMDCGCAFFTTQMFFDNEVLYHFLYRALKHGIDVPIVAGIMPVTNARQIKRMTALSGAPLPRKLRAIVERYGDNPDAMRQAGIAYTTDQIVDLAANGVNNIHIYTMNRPEIAGQIMQNLSAMIG